MDKRITMQQIADYLGVSKYVVSKALAGKSGVAAATRERVMKTAAELGYFTQGLSGPVHPMGSAGMGGISGSTKDKGNIIVFMPNIRMQTKESSYWGKILEGISAQAEKLDVGLISISTNSADALFQVVRPDSAIGLIGVGTVEDSLLLEIHRSQLPFVLIDHESPLVPCDTVFANNMDGMSRLTRHMSGLGHRSLVFVGNPQFSRSFRDRYAGFREVMLEYGLTFDSSLQKELLGLEGLVQGEYEEQLVDILGRVENPATLPTAYLCANDSIAQGLVFAMRSIGLQVPADASVSGFDNLYPGDNGMPLLTTLAVPIGQLGARALETLLRRLRNPSDPFEKIMVSGELLFRETTGHSAERA